MKRTYLGVLFLVGALMLAACGGNPTAVPTNPPATPTTAAATATTAPTSAATTVAMATNAPTMAATPGAAEGTEISIEPANPKPTSTPPGIRGTPPATGGGTINATEGAPPISVGTVPAVNPPTTLDDLIKAYPDLKPFIDKLPQNLGDSDLAELYKRIVQIYKDKGASGLAAFLKDSGILDKLGIPLSYIDLLTAYGDKGDAKAVEKLARDRKIINGSNEIAGYLALDSKDSLPSVTTDLKALGVSVYSYDDNNEEVEIGIPLSVLGQFQSPGPLLGYLTKIAKVNHVVGFRPPTPKTAKIVNLQNLNTKGAVTIGADKWHKAGITGKGVRIGILDMGFGGIMQNAGKALPPADQMKSNVPLDELDQQEEVHGTACAMVVHGAAPDAELYIAQFDGSSRESWINAVQFLLDSKVQIINYSVGSAVGPRDGTFGESLAVDAIVKDSGVLWVNAAGNEAVDHTMFQYQDNGKGLHAFSEKLAALPFVPFAPITTVVMNWNGNWGGKEKAEYDFRVLDKDGNEVVTAAEAKKGRKNDFPFQATSFEATPKELYYLIVHKEKGNDDNLIDIFVPNAIFPDWAQVPDHSVTVPGDSNSALTVGATGLTKDKIEIYSSQGPTNDDRIKPDITAPTGEVLPVYEDGFSGTSGAAPLVAGAAGLVLEKFPEMQAAEVRAFLLANVKDLGDKGPDPVFGEGRLALPDPGKLTDANPSDADATPVPEANGPSATINNIDTKFNVKLKGVKGMAVTVSFEVDNFKGKKGAVAVLFFDSNNKPLPTKDENFRIGKGLGTGATFTAKSNQAAFDDVVLFIPNSAFTSIGSGNLYYIVAVLDLNNLDQPLAVSDKVSIKLKK